MPFSSPPAWLIYALLGAFFAACVQVTSKPANDKLGENAVSLLRTCVMQVFFVGVVIYETMWRAKLAGVAANPTTAEHAAAATQQAGSNGFGWPTTLAIASGLAASLSWFFGYKALTLSVVSKTYPIDKLSVAFGVVLALIFLGDRPSLINWVGIVVMLGGAYLVTLKGN